MLSDFRKSQIRKSPIFSEGARVVLVKNSSLGQTTKHFENAGVDLDCVGPDLSIYEVKIQKEVKTLAGQIFSGGLCSFLAKYHI